MTLNKSHIGGFAIWKYELFPFVKGGTITEVSGDGVITKEYGQGYLFKPIKVFKDK